MAKRKGRDQRRTPASEGVKVEKAVAPAPKRDDAALRFYPPAAWIPRLRILAIAIIALQILVPLSYYVSSDPYDERFSWRMFSAVRVRTCATTVVEETEAGARPLDLAKVIHGAWIETLRRNRPQVIRKLLDFRCHEGDVTAVTLTNQCTSPGHERLPDIVWSRNCRTGEVTEPESLE